MKDYRKIIYDILNKTSALGHITNFTVMVDPITLREMQMQSNYAFWTHCYDYRRNELLGMPVEVVALDTRHEQRFTRTTSSDRDPNDTIAFYPCLAIRFEHPVTGRTTYIDSDLSDPVFIGG